MEPMSTDRVLADFEGIWVLEKRVQHADRSEAIFEGQATWSPDPQGMRYEEKGRLCIAGHAPMQTTRSYIWTPDLGILFEDGRFFHAVPPHGGAAHHHCDPDDYHVTYDFAAWPKFSATWRVMGPRKNYLMDMWYSRRS